MTFHQVMARLISLSYPFIYIGHKNPHKINNLKYNLRKNSHDKLSVWEVFKTKTYFDNEFTINKGDIVLDIGSHIGTFAIKAASLSKTGKVFAIEPNPDNFSMLKSNIKLNKLKNIYPIFGAVSSKKHQLTIFMSKINNTAHSIYGNELDLPLKINAISLVGFFKKNNIKKIHYLKIDTEGAEYDILLNTPPSLFKKIDKIVIEYHDHLQHGHNVSELCDLLKKNGFKVKKEGFLRDLLKIGMIKAQR